MVSRQLSRPQQEMNSNRVSLYFIVSRARFGSQNSLMTSLNTGENNQMRVMSTPQWPVPYYQRAFKDAQNVDKIEGDFECVMSKADDCNVILAKEKLLMEGKGYVVEAIEQHYDITSYITFFESSEKFSAAYTDDLLDCLGVAQAENARLLTENDFSDVFN